MNKNSYEPEVDGLLVEGGNLMVAATASAAISLKRIADTLEVQAKVAQGLIAQRDGFGL